MVCQHPSVKLREAFPTAFFAAQTNVMDVLRFHCVICGKPLEIASSLAGAVIECQSCLRIVPIPSLLSFPHEKVSLLPVLPRDILAVEIKILCGRCQSKLRLDARLEGTLVTCPACAAEVRVPLWSQSPKPPGATPVSLSAAEIEFLSAAEPPAA